MADITREELETFGRQIEMLGQSGIDQLAIFAETLGPSVPSKNALGMTIMAYLCIAYDDPVTHNLLTEVGRKLRSAPHDQMTELSRTLTEYLDNHE